MGKHHCFSLVRKDAQFSPWKLKKKYEIDTPALKSGLSHLANSYLHNYKPSRSILIKHGTLKKLKNDRSIVILRPDKGNGVMVLDRISMHWKIFRASSEQFIMLNKMHTHSFPFYF